MTIWVISPLFFYQNKSLYEKGTKFMVKIELNTKNIMIAILHVTILN